MKKNSKIQKNNFKSIILTLIVMAAIIIPTHVALALSSQVVNSGGSNTTKWSSDGVQVSKTVKATGIEDYFDITLQVKSKNSVKTIMESDSVAVVFVLDLSETMTADINGASTSTVANRKISKAISAIQSFANTFAANSSDYPNNVMGAVGFNTHGKDLVSLTKVANKNSFNSSLETNANKIVNANGYSNSIDKFTNIEAGLKKARTMLNGSNAKYKYVIFVSDGMPTTYCKSGYTGYDPHDLHDGLNKGRRLFEYGGNYSDTGAIKARQVAMDLKNKGITIFSVGVGLGTFSGWPGTNAPYNRDSAKKLNGEQLLVNELARSVLGSNASSVENAFDDITGGRTGLTYWNTYKSTIYKLPWEIRRDYSGYANYYWNGTGNTPMYGALSETESTTDNRTMFRNWLRYGIGSNKYYDVTDANGLKNAIDSIYNVLNNDVINKRTDVWTTTDPMTNYNTTTSDYIDFQGFLNASGNVVQSTTISGSHVLNGNNTAEFKKNQSTDPAGTITWNLQKSGYTTETIDGATAYVYTLKYRVRLKVEKQGFSDTASYDTNGTTTLTYVNLVNGVASGVKKLYYPIPKVKGYLEDLKITKTVEGIASGKSLSSAYSTYTYRVTFKDSKGNNVGNEFTYDKYSGTNTTPIASSTIKSNGTFTLGNNEYVVIHKLYHDITWTVTEDAHNGFKQTISSVSPNTVTKLGVTATGTTKSATPLYEVNYKNKLYQLKLKKFDGDTSKNLEGVKFTLYSSLDGDGNPINPVTNMNGELLENLTTDSNGIIDLGNLSFTAGGSTTYYLKEVDTIDRYNLLDTYITVVVNENGITSSYTGHDFDNSNSNVQTISPSENMFEIDVPNIIGITLPQTGGSGEGGMISKTIGMILIILACIGYLLTEKLENIDKRRGEKKMKKYLKLMFTFLLSIVMIGNVYAKMTGDSFTITINDTENGHIYEAYQILTGDVSNTTDTTTGKRFFSNIAWGNGVDSSFTTQTAKQYAETLNGYADNSDDAIAVTKVLAQNLTNTKYTSGDFDSANNKYTISVPKTGYYLVREAKTNVDGKKEYMGTGYIVNLADNIEVRPKRSIPVPTKVINEGEGVHASSKYAVGENVPFKLTGTMPENYDFFETYKYVFHDTLSSGLQFNQASVKVFVKNGTTTTELGASSYEIVNPSTGSYTFDILFDDTKTGIVDKNGTAVTLTKNSTIIVEYNATVLTGAVRGTDGNSNKMLIEYSNNPGTDETGTTTEIETKVYIFDLELTKIGSDTNNSPLANARFKLERQTSDGAWEVVRGITYQADTPNGIHTFKGLSEGTYRVTEIETPDGYNTIAPFTFTVTPNYNNTKTTLESVTLSTTRSDELTDLAFDSSDTKYTTMKTTITNSKGITLPLTGGMGSTIFTIAGLALMAIAIITLIKNRKENN